jgi:hypothetical protein
VNSLSPPRLPRKTVTGQEWKLEALGDLLLDKDGCALIALVGVFLVDGSVVLLRIVAALEDDGDELSKLAQGVAGIMHVCL